MAASLGQVLQNDSAALQAAFQFELQAARMEIQMLLQFVLRVSRAYLLAHPERELNDAERASYRALLQRRLAGEPIAYILGEREFYGLHFRVTPAALIPRPETELLVESALQKLPSGKKVRVLDLGTGTGAIALSISSARPDAEVVAVDASTVALEVARENARRLNLRNVHLMRSDWFSALDGQRFDLIVSNPPYIAAGDPHLAQGDVRFEPLAALVSGGDGLDDIRRIIEQAGRFLECRAWLLLEHGYDQAARVRRLLQRENFINLYSVNDLSGIERLSLGQMPV